MNPALQAAKTQVVFAYEELGLSPVEISSQFEEYGFSTEDIITLLSEHSSKYRQGLQERTEEQSRGESTPEELEQLLAEYRHLSRASDNDLVKERALKYLINEKKGRNDLAARGLLLKEKALGMTQVNTSKRAQEFILVMQQINERLKQVAGGTIPPILELEK